ncbi:MAG: hypothetical protein PSV35_05530 [bacterium]|nr:hypothetical protein [bacterium]
MKQKNLLLVSALSSILASFSLNAGSMGDATVGDTGKFLLIEGGASYMNAFYKNNVVAAESVTSASPFGFSYNPSRIFGNNFVGGYMGASLMFNSLLLNARYELFATKSKTSFNGNVITHMAPARLAFTLDKTWSANESFIYGLGAGVVSSTHNKAEIYNYLSTSQIGRSFPGRNRLDPVVEAVVMYKLCDNFNIRGNVAYQIPAQSFYTDGNIGVNLGINYAIPL